MICCAVTALYLRRWDVAVAWIVILYCTVCCPGVFHRPSARSTGCPNSRHRLRRRNVGQTDGLARACRRYAIRAAFHVHRCYTRCGGPSSSYTLNTLHVSATSSDEPLDIAALGRRRKKILSLSPLRTTTTNRDAGGRLDDPPFPVDSSFYR